jgi:hypothetical protein
VDHEIAAWRLACERGLPFSFRGLGRSMLPALRPGDEALFAPLRAAPRPGEVLLYRAGDRLVAHRLIATHADGQLRLRGDFLPADDPPVPRAAVLGHLVAVRRNGRELRADAGWLAWYAAAIPRLSRRAPLALGVLQLCARVAARLTVPGREG